MEQLISISFGISVLGGVYDLFTKRIPNWLTFPAMLLGFAAQFILGGPSQGLSSFLGLGTGFLLLAPIWILQYMGAGDVKLLMAIGAWTNPKHCLYVTIGAICFGGIYAFFDVLFRGRIKIFIRSTYLFLLSVLAPGFPRTELNLDKDRKFTFGICLTLGQALVIALQAAGKL